jgi:hypothetical protein
MDVRGAYGNHHGSLPFAIGRMTPEAKRTVYGG